MIEKYHIKPTNTYNFDEKGFLMGICRTMKRIVPIDHLRSKKTLGASQDGSREFISLLATICADGSALPPALIYQGASGDLQDTWIEDYDCSSDEAYFAVSKKGWTNEELGLSWLSKLFEPITRNKAGNSRRLLIVDGHSSHLNSRFLNFCNDHGIILGILPPHSTHRLQPLDVGIFSPLSTAYSNEIDHLIQSSHGFSRITKRSFWPMFRGAWKTALTFENIRSAFAATAIYPLAPEKVLNQLKGKTPSPISSDSEAKRKTPGSVRGIRRAVKALRAEATNVAAEMDLIIRASEKLAIRAELLEHENTGLRTALVGEKKRRKRGKPMGLFIKDEPGQAVFFSPAKIAAVRARQEELEAQRNQEKLEKEVERQDRAAERERKAQEVQERRETRQRIRTEKLEQKERDKEARTVQKQLNQQLVLENQAQKDQNKQSRIARKRKPQDAPPVEPQEPKTRKARSGRIIALPSRLKD
jgi:PAS domain-containing protein